MQDDVVDERLELPLLPASGGSLVNQISTYCPDAELLVWNVWVPAPTFFSLATLVNEARPCGETVLLLPTSMLTLAPAAGPNVSCTELSRTGLPMSRIRPVPFFRPPKTGLPS